jgi:RNA polymerase sigma factor (sigma-70 family)
MSNAPPVAEPRAVPEAVAGSDFESFYEAHRLALFRAALVLTRDATAAEDVAQDAFVRVWQRWERVRALEDPVGYLYRTALHGWFQVHRRASRAAKRTLMSRQLIDPIETVEERDFLARRLLLLPARQRAAIVLTDYLDLDSGEAARTLGIRPGTVRRLASLARARLRAMEEGEEP